MGGRVPSIVPTRFGLSITKVAERCIRSMAEDARMTQPWPRVRFDAGRFSGSREQKNESARACGPLRRYSRQKSLNRVGAAFEV